MLPERFRAKFRVGSDSGCWNWTAAKRSGYGAYYVDGKMRLAHRHAYELLIGAIPPGMQLDHLCRNRSCVNPQHLEPVTDSENKRRSPLVAEHMAQRGARGRAAGVAAGLAEELRDA